MTPATPVIDLRSDTVTRPSPAMRRAMAEAEVGDDVLGDDPTVRRLQDRVADLLGTEAALFVPSGTMANQIALHVNARPGDDVLVGRSAHTYTFEAGAGGAFAGVQFTVLDGDGRFSAAQVEAAYKPDDHHAPPTSLVVVENTHNMGGGLCWDRDALAGVLAAARRLGLRAHLDGARLWNAAVAQGVPERDLAAGFDTVQVCLSKGLGAPAGSLICGRADDIRRAHRLRKMLGGAMRQVGILAAAGLFALDHNRARLADDHANARLLGEALANADGFSVDVDRIHTNIVLVDVDVSRGTAADVARRAAHRGVLVVPVGPQRLRLVTHYDVDRAACARAAELLAAA
ncbi:MAG: aminotransferase class I/II-fold pyridoxal phosphate-dependent enzyme [Deltaproteobacteria bacterium]|nr:MAG: aminotransferase class I/II-fold pyridoxal phosphate-dependent enzyme [Deltaproteobacteria bacterium]